MNDCAPDDGKPKETGRRKAKKLVAITAKMLESVVADAVRGRERTLADRGCPGLELRGRKGGRVTWSIRYRWRRRQKRAVLGDQSLTPERAREYGWAVREKIKQHIDPGDVIFLAQHDGLGQRDRLKALGEVTAVKAMLWEDAVERFLADKKRTRRFASWDDYRNRLHNMPELKALHGRTLADITARDIGAVYAKIHSRNESQAEHIKPIISSMYGHLLTVDDVETGLTEERAAAVRAKRPPERTRSEYGEGRQISQLKIPPTIEEIGRTIYIAKSGALTPRASAAILITAATAQRRRTVASMNDLRLVFHDMLDGPEFEWNVPPAHRKTGSAPRSQLDHVIPLVGWAATSVQNIRRLTNSPWLFPAGPTDAGKEPRFPHVDPGHITKLHSWLPNSFNPHRWRKAFTTYGEQHLGFTKANCKMVLDHLEGHVGTDTTAMSYGLDAKIALKRRMLQGWQNWLDEQAAAAVEREPWLSDLELVRQKFYRARYGEEAYQRAIDRARDKKTPLPWLQAVGDE